MKEKLEKTIIEFNKNRIGAFIPEMYEVANLLFDEFSVEELKQAYEARCCSSDFSIYFHVKFIKGKGREERHEEWTKEDKECVHSFLGFKDEESKSRVVFRERKGDSLFGSPSKEEMILYINIAKNIQLKVEKMSVKRM